MNTKTVLIDISYELDKELRELLSKDAPEGFTVKLQDYRTKLFNGAMREAIKGLKANEQSKG